MHSFVSSIGTRQPIAYTTTVFGDLGLYYIEKPVKSTDAYALADSLGGVIATESCIWKMIQNCDLLVSDTPGHLIVAGYPGDVSLDVGNIRNGRELRVTGHPLGDNYVQDGIFIYGPVPKDIGQLIVRDTYGKYSGECLVD